MTANLHWPEVEAALLPRQKLEDRLDIVTCVIHAKQDELMRDITKKDCCGKCIGLSYSNKFQKCVLPHTHSVGYLNSASKLHSPEDIDSLLSVEFPDPDTQSELFELVKKFMVHNLFGKCFLHGFRNQKMLQELSKAIPRTDTF